MLAPETGLAFDPSNAYDYAGIIPVPNLNAHALPEKANQDRSACHTSFSSRATVDYKARHPLPKYPSSHAPPIAPQAFSHYNSQS